MESHDDQFVEHYLKLFPCKQFKSRTFSIFRNSSHRSGPINTGVVREPQWSSRRYSSFPIRALGDHNTIALAMTLSSTSPYFLMTYHLSFTKADALARTWKPFRPGVWCDDSLHLHQLRLLAAYLADGRRCFHGHGLMVLCVPCSASNLESTWTGLGGRTHPSHMICL